MSGSVLIVVVWSTFVTGISEKHFEFPDMAECRQSMQSMNLPTDTGFAVCVTKQSEKWFYPSLKGL